MFNQSGLCRDTAGYRDRDMATRGVLKSTNEILGGVGTNPSNMGGAVGGMSANETTAHSIDDNGNNFVPSVVYLPVARRVSEPMTVAFDLTPA